jgi:hypothetical protein
MYYGTEGKPFLTIVNMAGLHVLLVPFIAVLNVEVAQVVRRLGVGNDADKVAQDALLQELLCQVLQKNNNNNNKNDHTMDLPSSAKIKRKQNASKNSTTKTKPVSHCKVPPKTPNSNHSL